MNMRTTVTFLLLVFAFGCAPIGQLKKRAAFDLDCPQTQLEVIDLESNTYGVRGCGSRAT